MESGGRNALCVYDEPSSKVTVVEEVVDQDPCLWLGRDGQCRTLTSTPMLSCLHILVFFLVCLACRQLEPESLIPTPEMLKFFLETSALPHKVFGGPCRVSDLAATNSWRGRVQQLTMASSYRPVRQQEREPPR